MSLNNPSPYFVHFGCWNNGGCPDNNDVTRVLEKVKSLQPPPDFLSVCGDNYYPTKIKDIQTSSTKKYLDIDKLRSGFECLPTNMPIYMTYGNHDFETNLIQNDTEIVETDCQLTKNELSIVETKPNVHLNLFQQTVFNQNTQLLFLDTTIYDDEDGQNLEDLSEFIHCYNNVKDSNAQSLITNNQTINNTIHNIREKQQMFIRSVVSSVVENNNISNFVIIGHHPLALFKYKKQKMIFIVLSQMLNALLYDEIYIKLSERNINYFYLCADLHQYQPGNIIIKDNMHIRQYIVGTGGTILDNLIRESLFKNVMTKGNIQYSMTEIDINNALEQHGFLTCVASGTNINFDFVRVEPLKGGKKQTIKKYNKTRKIKNKKNKTRKIKNKKNKTRKNINKRK